MRNAHFYQKHKKVCPQTQEQIPLVTWYELVGPKSVGSIFLFGKYQQNIYSGMLFLNEGTTPNL